jgi:hypothetical protein
MNALARRRFRKRVKRLDYPTAANLLQALAHAGYEDARVMLILAEHAWSVCPNDQSADSIRRWRDVYAQGRLVKFATGKVTAVDGISTATIDEINSIEVFEDEE